METQAKRDWLGWVALVAILAVLFAPAIRTGSLWDSLPGIALNLAYDYRVEQKVLGTVIVGLRSIGIQVGGVVQSRGPVLVGITKTNSVPSERLDRQRTVERDAMTEIKRRYEQNRFRWTPTREERGLLVRTDCQDSLLAH